MKKLLLLLILVILGSTQANAQQAISVANEAGTGTTVGKLAKLTGAPSTAILTGTGDLDGIIGIVVAQDATATTGNAKIAVLGPANCTFDASGVTAGHYVINSTLTAGDCADGGASRPTANQVIGRALATVASGTAAIELERNFTNAAGSGTPANPTATAGPTAVNGSASTFLRSDGAPAVQKGTNAQFGIVEGDGSTLTCVAGVCTAIGGSATSIVPGTTTVGGATAPCLIDNSATTTMGCAAVGTGVLTALGVNTGSAGSFTKNNGDALSGTFSGTPTFSGNFTASGVPLFTGLSAGTIAAGKNLGLDSGNNLVTATVSGGSVTCPTGFTATVGGTCSWKQTASASASLAWTGLTGNNYRLKCSQLLASSAGTATFTIQVGEGGTPTYQVTNYGWQQFYGGTGVSPAAAGQTNDSGWNIATSGATSGSGVQLGFDILHMASGFNTGFSGVTYAAQASALTVQYSGDFYANTTAKTALKIFPPTGTFTGECTLVAED